MTGFGTLLAAGLILLAAAAVADLLGSPRSALWRRVPYLTGAAASVCLAVAGAAALAGRSVALRTSGLLGDVAIGPAGHGHGTSGAAPLLAAAGSLAADRLSGLFLVVTFAAAALVSLVLVSWVAGPGGTDAGVAGRRGLGAAYALVLGAVAVVLTAQDAFTFLAGWELVTLGFWLLTAFGRHAAGRPAAALVTLAFGRVSGASLLAGLLLLVTRSGSLALASFAHIPAGPVRASAVVLLVAGFAVKVGLTPFQVWLPRGYAAAPGPARAIMAGVAVNIGFYGLWRTLALLGPPPAAVTDIVLLLGALTALLGIAHAAVQGSLQRVIAYSSVENAGLILAGFGVALTAYQLRPPDRGALIAAGLLAATLQVIAHTAAKSLLFASSAGVQAAAGSDDTDQLRGSARRAPWSSTGLAVGSLTLAGLPPTAGFVSEWFLLEALMQQFRVPGLTDRLVLALTGAAVALTAGFAGVTFVRLIGLVVLGKPAGRPPRQGADSGLAGRAGMTLLGLACLALAALTPLEIRMIAAGLSPILPPGAVTGALASPWVLQPVFTGFSVLSPSWLWIVMPALLAIVAVATWLASGRTMLQVRRVPAWRSATAGVAGRDSYTAFGFASPTRRVLATVLRTRTVVTRRAAGQSPAAGDVPAGQADAAVHVGYRSDVIEVVEQYLYRPLRRPFGMLVALAQRLQSGHLAAYLAYMLIALLAVLAVVAGLH